MRRILVLGSLLVLAAPAFLSCNRSGSPTTPAAKVVGVTLLNRGALFYRDLKILTKPMAHISGSVGYRIEFKDGKSIAISGDTDYCQNIIDLGLKLTFLS